MIEPTPIDISNNPDLLRLVEEVEATQTPRKLMRENKPLAILMPIASSGKRHKKRGKTKADYEAFRSAAGSWKDVDANTLLKNIYEDRRWTNTRPPVEL